MINSFKDYLSKPKSKIGFGHGIITILGAIILGYLTMMIYSKAMVGDYGVKIVPSMVLTPLLISLYAIWLLFSNTIIHCIKKFSILTLIFIIILKVV